MAATSSTRPARRPGPLVLTALAYLLAASGIMIWRGISVSPDYLLLLLVPVALVSGHFVRFIGDWVPFIAILLGWEAMRGIAARSGIAPHVNDLASLEHRIFGGHFPTVVLQDAVAGVHLGHVVDYLATVVYFCHFILPIAVGMVLWLVDRTRFLRFTTALMGMAFAAFVVYLLAPTAPPWYAQDHYVACCFRHVIGNTLPSVVSPYYSSLNPNPVAALPSLHAAFPFLCFLATRAAFPRASYLLLAYAALVWFCVVYLGEHWVVDVAAGVAFAAATWAVMSFAVFPRVAALRSPATPARGAGPGVTTRAEDAAG